MLAGLVGLGWSRVPERENYGVYLQVSVPDGPSSGLDLRQVM